MELVTAVVGITDVSLRTSSKLWKLSGSWRDAPSNLHRLRDDMTRTQEFFEEIRNHVMDGSAPAVTGNQSTNIQHLLDQGAAVLQRIEQIVEKIDRGGNGEANEPQELKRRRKLVWLMNERAVSGLRKELGIIVSRVCQFMIARNVQISAETSDLVKTWKAEFESQIGVVVHNASRRSAFVEEAKQLPGTAGKTPLMIDEQHGTMEEAILHQTSGHLESLSSHLIVAVRESVAKEMALYRQPRDPWEDTYHHHHHHHHQRPLAPNSPDNPALLTCSWPTNHNITPTPPSPRLTRQICRCPCHFATTRIHWSISSLHLALGSLTLTYSSRPSNTHLCQLPSCTSHRHRQPFHNLRLTYRFPPWLLRTTLSLFLSSNLHGSPALNLRVSYQLNELDLPLNSHLRLCITNDDLPAAKQMLVDGRASIHDVWLPYASGPLWAALAMRNYSFVKMLLEAGADPYQPISGYGDISPIIIAFEFSISGSQTEREIARLFPLIDFLEEGDFSPLHLAVCGVLHMDVGDAVQQPRYKLQMDARNIRGSTPLHLACIKGDQGAIEALVRAGADVEVTDKTNCTPLMFACRYGHLQAVRLLLEEAGANPNRGDFNGLTALHHIVRVGGTNEHLPAIASLLVRYGADINAGDKSLLTPLFHALHQGRTDAVKCFIDHGADVNWRDLKKSTPLLLAVTATRADLVRMLLRAGADATMSLPCRTNILHVIARFGNVEIIKVFEEVVGDMRGVDVELVADIDEEPNYLRAYLSNGTPAQLLDERNPSKELRVAFEDLLAGLRGRQLERQIGDGIGDDDGDVGWDGESDDDFVDARENLDEGL